jgi:hypothetical protein
MNSRSSFSDVANISQGFDEVVATTLAEGWVSPDTAARVLGMLQKSKDMLVRIYLEDVACTE